MTEKLDAVKQGCRECRQQDHHLVTCKFHRATKGFALVLDSERKDFGRMAQATAPAPPIEDGTHELVECVIPNVCNRASCGQQRRTNSVPPARVSITPLLQKIVEICDAGSAQEFDDADERLRAIRHLIIGEAV